MSYFLTRRLDARGETCSCSEMNSQGSKKPAIPPTAAVLETRLNCAWSKFLQHTIFQHYGGGRGWVGAGSNLSLFDTVESTLQLAPKSTG